MRRHHIRVCIRKQVSTHLNSAAALFFHHVENCSATIVCFYEEWLIWLKQTSWPVHLQGETCQKLKHYYKAGQMSIRRTVSAGRRYRLVSRFSDDHLYICIVLKYNLLSIAQGIICLTAGVPLKQDVLMTFWSILGFRPNCDMLIHIIVKLSTR